MRTLSLSPLLVLLLASPSWARGGGPASGEQRALLDVLYPEATGVELEEGAVTPGRFLVELDTVELDARREAVLVVTSALAREADAYYDQTLEAELAVVGKRGSELEVLTREGISVPAASGSREASVSTLVSGKKGEKVIQVAIRRSSDGEGSEVTLTLFQFLAGTEDAAAVFERIAEERYTPGTGSGYPHTREDVKLGTHPSLHEGYQDLTLTVDSGTCDVDEVCKETTRVERLCWTGTRYEKSEDCLVSTVTASSQLKGGKSTSPSYAPENVRDGQASSAWCEGAKGTGRGEWLRFEFNAPVTVQTLELVAGYDKSPEVWRANARLKQVRLHFSDGSRQDANLEDTRSPQSIRLKTREALESVKLEVLAVYPGSRYPDACVSEVDFSGARAARVTGE